MSLQGTTWQPNREQILNHSHKNFVTNAQMHQHPKTTLLQAQKHPFYVYVIPNLHSISLYA